jgi:membrane peptidoglycan carboxypeptidase
VAKIPGVAVGGKTGTAQVASMKGARIKSEDLPYDLRDHAWFVAFAPVEEPRIAVCVMLEHGGHGGSAAAPVVRQVMEEFFRLEKEAETAGGKKEGIPSDNGAGAGNVREKESPAGPAREGAAPPNPSLERMEGA